MATVPAIPQFPGGTAVTAATMKQFSDLMQLMFYTRPRAKFRQGTATTSIPNASWTTIAFDTTDFSTEGSNERSRQDGYFALTKGDYLVSATVCFAPNSANERFVRITVGGVVQYGVVNVPASPQYTTNVSITRLVRCNLNDLIQVQAFQNSTVTLNTAIATEDASVVDLHLVALNP